MEQPKVLVAAPIFDGMKYCLRQFLDSIHSLTYPNYQILIVDNSRTNDFIEELKKEPQIITIKDPTTEEQNLKRLVSSRNIILNHALKNNYEFVLMMDSDTIPPKDIIEELLAQKKDIVSGICYNYFRSSGQKKLLPCAWAPITESEFEKMKKQVQFPPMIKSHRDLRRHITREEVDSGKLIGVIQPCGGCLLISKKVFEKIRYGILPTPEGVFTSDDIYFATKAHEAGFKMYCHPKIKCDHLVKGKYKTRKDGRLLHPIHKDYPNQEG